MSAKGARGDIFHALIRDHRRAAALMDRISRDGGDPEARDALFFQLKEELEVHAIAEESTFYAALRDHPAGREKIDEASREHDRMTAILEELADMSANEGTWLANFMRLKVTVQRHLQDEETELFALARELLDQQQGRQLAQDLEAEERRLKKAA